MIKARNLQKKFATRPAVDGLSFEIAAGETFGLLGPNGAGKTTTISMLIGLLNPDSGSVEIGDPENRGGSPVDPGVRTRIGVAPQTLALYENLTAKENLDFFGQMYGLAADHLADRVEWALGFSQLGDRRHDRVRTFSGGMKRRLNIAVALIHEPGILLLDEPTIGVDPQSRNHIYQAVAELQQQGMTLLYTTHLMEEAQRLCDRVAILDEGRLLALDSVEGLIGQHGGKSVVTGELMQTVDPGAIDGLTAVTLDGNSIRFESGRPLEEVARLTAQGVVFQALQIKQPDLESVFLSLTGRSLRDQ